MFPSPLAVSSLFFTIPYVFAQVTPLCPDIIFTAGGGLPNTTLPNTVSASGIGEIQLAQFLENLEVEFFTVGAANLTSWGTAGFSNDSAEIVTKIAAVSIHIR